MRMRPASSNASSRCPIFSTWRDIRWWATGLIALQLVLYKRALRRGISTGHCTGITWLGVALLTTYQRLQAEGIEPILPINHGMTVSL